MVNILMVYDIHSIVQIASTIICGVLGICLVSPPYYKIRSEYQHVRPAKYIASRRALGIAYIITGVLTTIQMLLGPTRPPYAPSDSYPILGLLISTSQILLFTVAALSLLNSKLVRRTVILGNTYPIAIFFCLALVFQKHMELQKIIRITFFYFYVLQLVVYTLVFFVERRKYLNLIEDYFGMGKQYDFYKCKGVVIIYICSICVGFYALWSYFFTTPLQNTIFISVMTLFYINTAIYFLWYSKHSQRIQDITSPENWKMTEEFSRKYRQHEKKR